jgi:hypothetical protein
VGGESGRDAAAAEHGSITVLGLGNSTGSVMLDRRPKSHVNAHLRGL